MPFPLRPRRVTPRRASASQGPAPPAARPDPFVDILPALPAQGRSGRPWRESLRLWTLVLEARGVEYRLQEDVQTPGGWRLEVLEPDARRAGDEILAFERENRGGGRAMVHSPSPLALPGALVVVLGLVCVHGLSTGAGSGVTGLPAAHARWVELGAADARRMVVLDEWYRAATALTLHADIEHLGANACLGGVFLALGARELGLGVALAATIFSGVLGNMLNAWFHGGMHVSLGASTAVFGLLGTLTMHRSLALLRHDAPGWGDERPALAWARVFGPLAAGVFMLSLFGTGGEQGAARTDLLAHLFGFASGVGLGWILHVADGDCSRSRRPGVNLALGAGSLLLMAAAWRLALG